MRIALATLLLLLAALPASAGFIHALEPDHFEVDTKEPVLTILGSDLGNVVLFDGPAGRFEVKGENQENMVIVRVPAEVVSKSGFYWIMVRGEKGDSNLARLDINPPYYHSLVLLVPDPVVVPATSPNGANVEFTVIPYGGRDPNPTYTCDPKSGSFFPRGPSVARCVARNSFGEQAFGEVTIFVYDGNVPVLSLPERIVVDADDDRGTVVHFEATAKDDIDGELPVTCEPKSGSLFPIGITKVECYAYDSSINPGYGTFDVEVRGKGDDDGTLIVHVPNDITVEASSGAGSRVEFTVTASGTSDPNPTVTCDPISGSTFPLGTTTVLCTATDKFGNGAVGELDVTVVDTTRPNLVLVDITAQANGGSAVVSYDPTASDWVDGNVAVNCTPPSGSTFQLGSTVVTCSASDSRGNTATGSFFVHLVDSAGPFIATITADPNVLSPANHKLIDVTLTVDVADANDPSPQCAATTVSSNEAVDGPGSGNTKMDWNITGPFTLQLRAERSGEGTDRVYTIHVTCSDRTGNSSLGFVNVIVPKGSTNPSTGVVVVPPRRRSVGTP